MKSLLPLLAIPVLIILSGCGMTASSHNAGYADLDALSWQDVDTRMSLSFGPMLLGFAAMATEEDPQTRALLQGLDGVRVKVYDIDGDADRVAGDLERMNETLRQSGWEPVVRVREGGESTYVLMKLADEEIAGLTVLNSDGLEVVIVNVMGQLRPEMFSQAMSALEVPAPPVEVENTTDL